jgi:tRNA A37 methylthiotransferase MiaB
MHTFLDFNFSLWMNLFLSYYRIIYLIINLIYPYVQIIKTTTFRSFVSFAFSNVLRETKSDLVWEQLNTEIKHKKTASISAYKRQQKQHRKNYVLHKLRRWTKSIQNSSNGQSPYKIPHADKVHTTFLTRTKSVRHSWTDKVHRELLTKRIQNL